MSAVAVGMIGVAAVLIGIWLLLVSGRASPGARYPLALSSCGCAVSLALLMARSGTPSWRALPGAVAIVISLVLLLATVQRSMPSDSEGSGDDTDGGGGLGRRPPDRPTGGGGPAEPSWWPDFERDLARYMAERARSEGKGARVSL